MAGCQQRSRLADSQRPRIMHQETTKPLQYKGLRDRRSKEARAGFEPAVADLQSATSAEKLAGNAKILSIEGRASHAQAKTSIAGLLGHVERCDELSEADREFLRMFLSSRKA